MFDAKKVKNEIVQWIREWFEENGKDCNAVVGISGGKDSTVVAGLCAEALGPDRVIGVLMPNGRQNDFKDAVRVCDFLGIEYHVINIEDSVRAITKNMIAAGIDLSVQTLTNLPARIRMSTLYAVSQSKNGRVVNTCNLSEDWVGYSTRYGDGAGDFSPISRLTVTEVKMIGKELGLPEDLVEKVPFDGLCGKTDEDNLGYTYDVLDRYIRTGICEDEDVKRKIDADHRKNLFKLQPMPAYEYKWRGNFYFEELDK